MLAKITESIHDEEWDHFYKAFRPEARTLNQVLEKYGLHAQENTQDPSLLAVVDSGYETRGLLIVRLSPQRDSFRCKGAVAGEILRWIFVNFMTWDEAKSLASTA